MIKTIAKSAGYTDADINAGWEFYLRKNRKKNPPGEFDKAKRSTAKERTSKVIDARPPSRSFPCGKMSAARTAEHCAELYGATPLDVKRIAKACETYDEGAKSAHEQIEQVPEISKILKKVKLSKKA
tara:strand:- start:101 stop:481 length:381 start_codon:yes stop_codon:yes gene_type:complete